ncbi:MAG: hypothetical protein Q9186_006464 [Xanthomendoza sp. 1 TL-2023]
MATQSSKPPLKQLLNDVIITMKIEATNHVFHVHKGLLCYHSPVFRAMLEHEWQEKQDGIILLKDEDHETFGRFIFWLYYSTVIDHDEELNAIPAKKLVDCYFLADRRDVPALQNHIINTLIQKARAPGSITPLCLLQRLIWENTPEQSLLRKLMVDFPVLRCNLSTMLKDEKQKDQWDKSFLIDVVIEKYKNPSIISIDEFWKRRCTYHIHNEHVPPCSA